MKTLNVSCILIFTFLTLFFGINSIFAQHVKSDSGKVDILQDIRVKELLEKRIKADAKKNGKTQGYRVQINFGTDRNKARDVKAKFLMHYPSIGAYEEYEQPNFKIRVGNFRTRLEAFKFLKELSSEFTGSFIVQDEIELPEIE